MAVKKIQPSFFYSGILLSSRVLRPSTRFFLDILSVQNRKESTCLSPVSSSLQHLHHCPKAAFSQERKYPSPCRVQSVLGNDLFTKAKEWSWNVIHWKLDRGEEEGHNISSGVVLSRYFSYSVNPDRIMIQEYSRQLPLACDWKRKHYKSDGKKKKK